MIGFLKIPAHLTRPYFQQAFLTSEPSLLWRVCVLPVHLRQVHRLQTETDRQTDGQKDRLGEYTKTCPSNLENDVWMSIRFFDSLNLLQNQLGFQQRFLSSYVTVLYVLEGFLMLRLRA